MTNLHWLSQKQKFKCTSAEPCHQKWNWKNNQHVQQNKKITKNLKFKISGQTVKSYWLNTG